MEGVEWMGCDGAAIPGRHSLAAPTVTLGLTGRLVLSHAATGHLKGYRDKEGQRRRERWSEKERGRGREREWERERPLAFSWLQAFLWLTVEVREHHTLSLRAQESHQTTAVAFSQ